MYRLDGNGTRKQKKIKKKTTSNRSEWNKKLEKGRLQKMLLQLQAVSFSLHAFHFPIGRTKCSQHARNKLIKYFAWYFITFLSRWAMLPAIFFRYSTTHMICYVELCSVFPQRSYYWTPCFWCCWFDLLSSQFRSVSSYTSLHAKCLSTQSNLPLDI